MNATALADGIRTFGSTFFRGITFADWLALLQENRFAVDPAYRGRARATTAISLVNSAYHAAEELALGSVVRRAEIQPPVFILGHARSGTTHLFQLLASDPRFAFPNVYQCHFPQTFLTTEGHLAKLLGGLLPSSMREADNLVETLASPAEDEWAMGNMGAPSSMLSLAFPRRAEHYDRYIDFRGAAPVEVERWQLALRLFMQKLTWKYGRPLVMKSPAHTCRIQLLLRMFPDARFVHIHRHPFSVFKSVRHASEILERRGCLQTPSATESGDERIIQRYRDMYQVFHREKSLIPHGRFHEMSFGDLTRDPVGQMALCYEQLGLPDFAAVEQPLRERCAPLRHYQKNRFPDLPPATRRRLRRRWKLAFETWDYSEYEHADLAPAAVAASYPPSGQPFADSPQAERNLTG